MSDLDEMWERFEEYQPTADRRGYGAEWRRMCQERTPRAAKAVRDAAYWVARDAEWAVKTAIKCINQAEGKV